MVFITIKIPIFKKDPKIGYYVIITLVPKVPFDLKRGGRLLKNAKVAESVYNSFVVCASYKAYTKNKQAAMMLGFTKVVRAC